MKRLDHWDEVSDCHGNPSPCVTLFLIVHHPSPKYFQTRPFENEKIVKGWGVLGLNLNVVFGQTLPKKLSSAYEILQA